MLKERRDSDPGFMADMGGLLMPFVFGILFALICIIVYKIWKRVQCAKLLGRGNKQRIEHS